MAPAQETGGRDPVDAIHEPGRKAEWDAARARNREEPVAGDVDRTGTWPGWSTGRNGERINETHRMMKAVRAAGQAQGGPRRVEKVRVLSSRESRPVQTAPTAPSAGCNPDPSASPRETSGQGPIVQAPEGPSAGAEDQQAGCLQSTQNTGLLSLPPPDPAEFAAGNRPLLAVVDDYNLMRRTLELLLKPAGLDVACFHSAEAFLLSLGARRPRCLILDMDLPRSKAFELQARLNAKQPRIPVIFMTGCRAPGARVRALASGAVACLEKPVDRAVLMKAVDEALGAGT